MHRLGVLIPLRAGEGPSPCVREPQRPWESVVCLSGVNVCVRGQCGGLWTASGSRNVRWSLKDCRRGRAGGLRGRGFARLTAEESPLRMWSRPRARQLRSAAAQGRGALDEDRRTFITACWRWGGRPGPPAPVSSVPRRLRVRSSERSASGWRTSVIRSKRSSSRPWAMRRAFEIQILPRAGSPV